MKAAGCSHASGRPTAWATGSIRWASAGSAMAPRPRERDRDAELAGGDHLRESLHRPQGGAGDPGSRRRRGARPWCVGPRRGRTRRPRRRRCRAAGRARARGRRRCSRGATSVGVGAGSPPVTRCWRVRRSPAGRPCARRAGRRAPAPAPRRRPRARAPAAPRPPGRRARGCAELAHQQAGHGVVRLVLGQREAGRVAHLVGPQQAREDPRAVGAPAHARTVAVVLVGDVPDDLLHDVLEGDDALRSRRTRRRRSRAGSPPRAAARAAGPAAATPAPRSPRP